MNGGGASDEFIDLTGNMMLGSYHVAAARSEPPRKSYADRDRRQGVNYDGSWALTGSPGERPGSIDQGGEAAATLPQCAGALRPG